MTKISPNLNLNFNCSDTNLCSSNPNPYITNPNIAKPNIASPNIPNPNIAEPKITNTNTKTNN